MLLIPCPPPGLPRKETKESERSAFRHSLAPVSAIPSVQPRILAKSPLIPVADGCDSSKGTTLTAESAEELCGETSSGSGVGPLRVAFDPVAARSSGSRGSGGGNMEAPATCVLSDIVPDQHPPVEEYDKVPSSRTLRPSTTPSLAQGLHRTAAPCHCSAICLTTARLLWPPLAAFRCSPRTCGGFTSLSSCWVSWLRCSSAPGRLT